ncbi:hypothetical protein TSOC_009346 [Tetrabaena socialis]|uniref:Rhodanese domain-containing protein n=1 Tax=Tetrabaena socialis TaxID=47790 RepID=A0A2J7ZW41_9CHLO|nr:hypothetical protein TSOC_009346 [Tetrabaena socialis]|eukprot:PNH04480.1 hypothetical protein TSOC_009346 [Tetrabaena socialis]
MLQSRCAPATRPFTSRPCAARSRRCVAPRAALTGSSVDVEEGKRLLDQEGFKFLDLRPRAAYEREHITKPPRACINVPYESGFAARLSAVCPGKATKLLVCSMLPSWALTIGGPMT